GVADRAVRDQAVHDLPDRVGRDREADAVVPAGVALDLRGDADHVAVQVQEDATRVAVVDGRVRLDRIRDRKVVRCGDLTVQGADDPGRDGALEPEGAADRDDAVAYADAARARERERMELRRGRVDVDDGEIGRGVATDDLRGVALAVGERDPDRAGAGDDVLVRDDGARRFVD